MAAALLMTAAAVALSYRAAGDGPLLAAALGFCGILAAGSSAAYGVFSFFERETNTILAKICLGGAGILLVFWLAAVIAAL